MATKRFIIEVEEGVTKCDLSCPLMLPNGVCADVNENVERVIPFLKCRIYNLATMKIDDYDKYEENEGKALLYAVNKTVERTKKEIINKACEWFEKYLFDIGYPDDWCRDSQNLTSGKERFIKAMEK